MEKQGFIHEKLDLKILILYIMRRLPNFIASDELSQLAMCDEGVNYFDFTDCLSELIDTEHVEEQCDMFKITEKGIRNGEAIETSIPFTVRKKAEVALAPIAERMKRDALISTGHKNSDNGACVAELALSDGVGEVIYMRLMTPNVETSVKIENNFKQNAEEIYGRIIEMLSDK